MDISNFILYGGIQVIGLIIVLLQKKFRVLPNLFLILILGNILLHYIYYHFFYQALFTETSNIAFVIIPLAAVAPILIYYFVVSTLYGKINMSKKEYIHAIPFIFYISFAILFYLPEANKILWISLARNVLILMYLVYPLLLIKKIAVFYKLEKISFKIFDYNKDRISLVRLVVVMMLVHFIILVFKVNLPFIIPQSADLLNKINLSFFLVLAYFLSYVMISQPKTVLVKNGLVGLKGFNKYEKSKLTHSSAYDIMEKLNSIMEKDKPYLDADFDMENLSSLSGFSSHNISETLNGLVKQSFNDYRNNYRVEEFKRLVKLPEYSKFTILALAFESGFKSKSTFNAAFKKITNSTPSEFMKNL